MLGPLWLFATFEHLGMTPKILLGAADMYRFVADTPLGEETPETRDLDRDLDATIAGLAEALSEKTGRGRQKAEALP